MEENDRHHSMRAPPVNIPDDPAAVTTVVMSLTDR